MGAVVDQVRRLVDDGIAEIVLTGVDITAYGADLPGRPGLGGLVQRLLERVPGLARLRISSIDSVEVDEALIEAMSGEPRLMPHLHLSLQSGDDMILRRMKRRHSTADAAAFCRRIRDARPDIAFGADLIAGFPTETEAMFERTLAHVEDLGLAWLHVFPFSPRPGTPAARMPQTDRRTVKSRAARLRAAGAAARARFLAREVGAVRQMLVETGRTGRTEHYAEVDLDRPETPGTVVAAQITGHQGGRLTARRAA
jgi:threonylcarbamoyladenosine tRNA methylthiotransferase MtaB